MAAFRREPFDVVLMDVQMPEMDGFEATAAIRAWEQGTGSRTPVVAMTAHAMKGDREHCLERGMDGYVSKPLRLPALFEVIDGLVPAARERPPEPPPGRGFDEAVALDRVGGDRNLLQDLVETYRAESPRWRADLRGAVAAGDAAALRRTAHTLKGAIGLFGATAAVVAADRLERRAACGDLGGAAEALAALEEALERLVPELDAHDRGADSDLPPP